MNQQEKHARFNAFRRLCLINADAALQSAELLAGKNANHIAYHLTVLALEEIGKIFVGFREFLKEEEWSRESVNFGFDDHVKKLFLAIWGPSIGKEIITKEQWEENQGMASSLHQRRLESLYTSLSDTRPASAKISDEDIASLISFAQARLQLAQVEGEIVETPEENPDMDWLSEANKDPVKRNYIFGQESQHKLLELENPKAWVAWLRDHYRKQERALMELIEKEKNRTITTDPEKFIPKWKIKIKLITPSHSIRQQVLDGFNKTDTLLKLSKGGDPHTLLVEFTLPNSVTVDTLWQQGWFLSKFYVGALNIGTNGFFYWNAVLDTEKYYEKIQDVENKHLLEARLQSGLKLNWEARKMLVNINHLHVSKIVFDYFVQIRDKTLFRAVDKYLGALALLAKSDLHARFEVEIFNLFFVSLQQAIPPADSVDSPAGMINFLFPQLEKMIKTRAEFERIITLGWQLQHEPAQITAPITLAEVILMKQYSGFYFMTLAVRKLHQDDSLSLILEEGEL